MTDPRFAICDLRTEALAGGSDSNRQSSIVNHE